MTVEDDSVVMSAELVATAETGMGPDDIVRKTIRGLAALRGINLEDVGTGVGLPRSTFFRKLRGQGAAREFTAGEVAALAAFFRVEVGVLFSGLGYLECPQQDSNLRHTVYSRGALRSRKHLTLVASGPGTDEQGLAAAAPVRHLTAVPTAA